MGPNAASHSGAGACSQPFLNSNAGTTGRLAEKEKTDRYKASRLQLGMAFVPTIFTSSHDSDSSATEGYGTRRAVLNAILALAPTGRHGPWSSR